MSRHLCFLFLHYLQVLNVLESSVGGAEEGTPDEVRLIHSPCVCLCVSVCVSVCVRVLVRVCPCPEI